MPYAELVHPAGVADRRGWRARVPVVLLVVACVSIVVVAVSAAGRTPSELHFFASGHWVYHEGQDAAFHIDGASRNIDAEVPLGGKADPGSQVVQGGNAGYVVGQSRSVTFGKSDLRVTGVTPSPAGEPALTLEVNGGPYAVYRQSGKIVRFGDDAGLINLGGPVADPVATSGGTIWLHRTDNGYLCQLAKDAQRPSCPASAPRGHSGMLTVVDDQPVFIDTSADRMHLVSGDGLGEGVEMGVDVPPDARAASRDVGGRVAILNDRDHRLHLVDSRALTGSRLPEAPIDVSLAEADYAGPASTGDAVAVVNRSTNTVQTYDGEGQELHKKRLRGKPAERPLSTGEDGRVYADGEDGRHVVVVDHDGAVEEVPVAGGLPAGDGRGAGERKVDTPNQRGRDGSNPGDRNDRRDREESPARSESPPARSNQRPAQLDRPERKPDHQPPPAPASPPGTPADVSAAPGDASATVRWQPARSSGGARITRYRISWQGGSRTVSAGTRSARITGLTNGRGYVFTVAAGNSAGTGPGADSQRVTPRTPAGKPGAPRSVAASRGGSAALTVRWSAADANGAQITGYEVSWREPGGSGSADGSATVGANARSYTADWLRGGTDYEFSVRAVNSEGSGQPAVSNTVEAVCDDPEVTLSQSGDRMVVDIKCMDQDFDGEVRIRAYSEDDPEYEHTENATLEDQHLRGFDEIDYRRPGHEVYVEVQGESGTYESNRITWE